ncbi:hypothetical protein T439DRAFT_345383 [Meredithblackwellia eburnea MCA 4105]
MSGAIQQDNEEDYKAYRLVAENFLQSCKLPGIVAWGVIKHPSADNFIQVPELHDHTPDPKKTAEMNASWGSRTPSPEPIEISHATLNTTSPVLLVYTKKRLPTPDKVLGKGFKNFPGPEPWSLFAESIYRLDNQGRPHGPSERRRQYHDGRRVIFIHSSTSQHVPHLPPAYNFTLLPTAVEEWRGFNRTHHHPELVQAQESLAHPQARTSRVRPRIFQSDF